MEVHLTVMANTSVVRNGEHVAIFLKLHVDENVNITNIDQSHDSQKGIQNDELGKHILLDIPDVGAGA